ncbi:MAG: hypothetical protein K2Y04_04475 [Caulobacteraceae bacterium]|nr:hypothetical protein [Caulobacteraceae bacterium]
MSSSTIAQTGAGGGGAIPVASVKIGTANLISPSEARTYYDGLPTASTFTNSVLVSGQPVHNAPHAEITALARALSNDPDLIYAYVRNTVDTTFTYGVGKGAMGSIVDRNGTAFDQAQLMVLLLRAAGKTASFKNGTITLDAAQFTAWTGITRADAACRLLANGGIPGVVNGLSTADCNYGSANVSSVTMAHVWVVANISGTDYVFDPAYKPYTVKAGADVRAIAGLTTGQALQDASSGVQAGTDSGVAYVRSLNATGLNSRIQSAANALQTHIDANLQSGEVEDLIGGRQIVEIPTSTALRQTTLPYTSSVTHSWSNVPDAYRASVTVQITKVSPSNASVYNTIADRVLYFDDIYGRKLNFYSKYKPTGTSTSGDAFVGRLELVNERGEATVLASYTANENARLSYGQVKLTVNAPYAATGSGAAGTYMDVYSAKDVVYALPFTIVAGWGETSRGLVSKWGSRADMVLPMQVNPQGCETCGTGLPATAGDSRREQLAVEWLAQASRAGALHAQLAGSVFQSHYSIGVVSADAWVRYSGQAGETGPIMPWYSIGDSYDRLDIDTGFSLTSRTSDPVARRAGVHAIAATINALEGSVAAQIADLPDVTSTASRFAWGNAPPSAEDQATAGTGPRRFYAFSSSNSAAAADLVRVEGRGVDPTTINGWHSDVGEPVIGTSEVNQRRGRLASTISSYAAAGYSVVSSEDAFLGPGQRGGAYERPGTAQIWTHRPSFQRGGALIATRYDANGDPLEIAHVTVGAYDNAKGGGGGAQVDHNAQYDPSKMADLLKDEFVDRSAAAGVDLGSGNMSYTSPAALSVGQGDFPYSLSAGLTWRGGQPTNALTSHVSNAEPNGAWTTNWNNTLSVSASGLEAMGETDVRAVAGTVAAFLVMQDIYRATPTTEREVAAALTAAWWMKHLAGNVVTATVGSNSQQFLRRADGQWFSPGGRYATLTQTGQRTIVTERPSCSTANGYINTRGWSYSAVSFQLKSATGDVQSFQPWLADILPAGTEESCARVRGFRLTNWTFPQGVTINLTYGYTAGSDLPNLTEVSNNLGYKIVFNQSGRLGFSNGLTGSNLRAVSVDRGPYNEEAVSHTDPVGNVTHFTTRIDGPTLYRRYLFDRAYLARDPSKPSIEYTYDVFGRVTEARDAIAVASPATRGSHKFFIAEGFRGQREDPLGGRYTVETLSSGRASRHVDEMNRVSSAEFDGRGRVIRRTAAFGNITEFEYDERNNTTLVRRKPLAGCGTSVYNCQTSVVTATYNAWNKPATITLPATYLDGHPAHTWSFDYDIQGRLITQTSPEVFDGRSGSYRNAIWRTAYDSFGRVRWTKDPTDIEARMEYGSGNAGPCLTAQHAADQSSAVRQTTVFQCNAAGDVVLTTDPLSNTSTATFDANRRKLTETGPASTGIQTQWTYDADGNVLTESRWDSTASVWRTATTTYSLTNKPLTVTDPAEDMARTCYDALDRTRVAVDPTGRATRTTYNAASQPSLIERWFEANLSDPTCALTNTRPAEINTNRWREFEYNVGGLQSVEIDGNGNRTTLTYDGLARLTKTTYADGRVSHFLRNERDESYAIIRRNGEHHYTWHDPLGRIYWDWETTEGATWGQGRHTRTSYDLASRPTWTAVSTQTSSSYDAAQERDIRSYVYDDAGRVVSDRIQPNNGSMGTSQLILGYEYDRANNRTGIVWPDAYRATYRFDAANRADRVQFGPSGNPTQHQADIAHDSLSRRTGLTRSNGVNTSYAYETDSDLSQINHAWASGAGQTPATFGFQHDGAGRITLTQVNRPDLEWMPTAAEAASYGVPTNLNQTTSVNGVSLVWDINGNLDQHGTTDYQWTHGNRLWRVVKPASTTEYAYDSTDRRTIVIEDGVMTRTLWSGADEVGEYDTAGALQRRFIPDGSGAMDARLAMVSSTGDVSWFHTNHQGSVIAISNASGAATAFANYSEYGKFGTNAAGSPLNSPPGGSPFGYTGRQWDSKAGLYQYRARYYDPALGIFLSMDPIGTNDDPNLYGYVANDPVNRSDPTGMFWQDRNAYVGGRPISDGPLNNGHMYIATNARYRGDPEARIYSAGPRGSEGIWGPLVPAGPGSSINTNDTAAWRSLGTIDKVGAAERINAPSIVVEGVATNMGGNPDYELTPGFLSDGGCNSNCWGAAVVGDSEAIAAEQGRQPMGPNWSAQGSKPGGMDYPGQNYGGRVERTNPRCVPGDASEC